jgi:hypothetical protein|uniref:Uncharacterized protein n=1 Tax=Eutreptiella gymnastica TaxID=73025 RepID=A0A7S4GCF7_9EUGL|mmetsp:Transcript_41924/g.70866  ORF Transcript_41924/g.70866 Transcript_41924/m.70866 type:complete len:172 (-) Transcript_41924:322-837(-)
MASASIKAKYRNDQSAMPPTREPPHMPHNSTTSAGDSLLHLLGLDGSEMATVTWESSMVASLHLHQWNDDVAPTSVSSKAWRFVENQNQNWFGGLGSEWQHGIQHRVSHRCTEKSVPRQAMPPGVPGHAGVEHADMHEEGGTDKERQDLRTCSQPDTGLGTQGARTLCRAE